MLSVNDALSYDRDAIGIGRKGTIDRPYILKAPFWTVDTLFYAIPREKADLNFAFDIFQNIDWKKKDESTGVPSLSKTAINDIDVLAPKHGEQQTIGQFFAAIDHLITLHQRKFEKLTNVKKSMLEKMFPQNGSCYPAVRFKKFTDPWEQWKVSDVITDIARPIELMDNQRYQMVTVKRRNEGVVSRGFMYGRDILVKNYYEVHTDDYLISKRQLVHGANGLVPESLNNAVVSNEYMVCIGNEFVSAGFLALLSKTKSLKRDFFLSSYGVDIEKLVFDVDDWKKRLIVLPTIDEQNKICAYFRCLDNLITLHQRELEKLQSIKKFLLEKMFV